MNIPKIQSFTIVYQYNHRSMGFQNSITVNAIDKEKAMEQAKKEVSMCYGSDMLKKFSFK
jgi:hypothetical protein